MSQAPPLLAPGQIVGQHRVERLLGRGGIAEVYLVTELAFEVLQAMKVMVVDDADWGRRLIREGRAQFLVQHPNLVRVFGSATVLGRPALIMEYVQGVDLRHWLGEHRRAGSWPSLERALEIFRGILAGVEAVHDRGLVHRDLKPANILLELGSPTPVPKVTDFGLVKDLLQQPGTAEVTVAGTVMGTQGYIAPEQIWALPEIDARADVFTLGCILYLLVCGRAAFGDAELEKTFSKVLSDDWTDPREYRPDLPEPVLLAIRHSLVAERRERLPSCAAMRQVLDRGRSALVELGFSVEEDPDITSPVPEGGTERHGENLLARDPLRPPGDPNETVLMGADTVERMLNEGHPEPQGSADPATTTPRGPSPPRCPSGAPRRPRRGTPRHRLLPPPPRTDPLAQLPAAPGSSWGWGSRCSRGWRCRCC